MTDIASETPLYDVLVVGGGAAGVGTAVSLRHAGITNFAVIERRSIGASFDAWPAETRFITPSFPTNSIGMLDLNSIAIGASPAWGLQVEHPTGREYAEHLRGVAQAFQLPVLEGTNVDAVGIAEDGDFAVATSRGTLRAKCVVWAAGEFQYPHLNGFAGSELCRHTATIPSYREIEGDDFIVVGGYESGVDVAYHLACRGKRVRLFDRACPWASETSDPSIALSTYSLERMRDPRFQAQVELHPNAAVESVVFGGGLYEVATGGGRFQTASQPLYAGGFAGSHTLVADLFESRPDGFPLLNEHDESTRTPGLYLCGPSVRHDNHVFCFIYKYRQRFGVVARSIATSLGLATDELEAYYRQWGMLLDDLSCCGEECVC